MPSRRPTQLLALAACSLGLLTAVPFAGASSDYPSGDYPSTTTPPASTPDYPSDTPPPAPTPQPTTPNYPSGNYPTTPAATSPGYPTYPGQDPSCADYPTLPSHPGDLTYPYPTYPGYPECDYPGTTPPTTPAHCPPGTVGVPPHCQVVIPPPTTPVVTTPVVTTPVVTTPPVVIPPVVVPPVVVVPDPAPDTGTVPEQSGPAPSPSAPAQPTPAGPIVVPAKPTLAFKGKVKVTKAGDFSVACVVGNAPKGSKCRLRIVVGAGKVIASATTPVLGDAGRLRLSVPKSKRLQLKRSKSVRVVLDLLATDGSVILTTASDAVEKVILARPTSRVRLAAAVRRIVAVAAILTGVAVSAAPAHAAEYGMSDGRPVLFDSGDLQSINFQHVRLVLPWDAAWKDGTWRDWLDRAQRQGFPILVAPSIDDAHSCTGGSCAGPSVADYSAALSALLAQYPGITSVEAWNEPNHGMQPTSRSAAMAAHYFDAAYDICGSRCTAVAGNMLDVPSMGSYLRTYRAALTRTPAVWGIHNYYDATYFDRSGIDQMLAVTDGPVWITETGGLVTFRSPSGTLQYDEERAADSLRWLFTIALSTPRIQRMYLYGMWEQKNNAFDSALLREDNSEREGMRVVRAYVGKRAIRLPGDEAPLIPDMPGVDWTDDGKVAHDADGRAYPVSASPTTAAGAVAATGAGQLRVTGKRLAIDGKRRIRVALRCVGPAACAGRIEVTVGRWRYARSVQLAPGATRTVRVRLSRAAAGQLTRRPQSAAWAAACVTPTACVGGARIPLIRR